MLWGKLQPLKPPSRAWARKGWARRKKLTTKHQKRTAPLSWGHFPLFHGLEEVLLSPSSLQTEDKTLPLPRRVQSHAPPVLPHGTPLPFSLPVFRSHPPFFPDIMCPVSRKAAPFTPAPFALGCTLPQDSPDYTSVPISTGPEGQVALLGAHPLQPFSSLPASRGRASRVPLAFTPFAHPGSWAAPWIRTLSGTLPLDNLQCLGLAEAIVRGKEYCIFTRAAAPAKVFPYLSDGSRLCGHPENTLRLSLWGQGRGCPAHPQEAMELGVLPF